MLLLSREDEDVKHGVPMSMVGVKGSWGKEKCVICREGLWRWQLKVPVEGGRAYYACAKKVSTMK